MTPKVGALSEDTRYSASSLNFVTVRKAIQYAFVRSLIRCKRARGQSLRTILFTLARSMRIFTGTVNIFVHYECRIVILIISEHNKGQPTAFSRKQTLTATIMHLFAQSLRVAIISSNYSTFQCESLFSFNAMIASIIGSILVFDFTETKIRRTIKVCSRFDLRQRYIQQID